MALATVAAAIAQLNENLLWEGSTAKALLALEAVRYLKVNRPVESKDGQFWMTFEALGAMEKELKAFLDARGAGASQSKFTRARAKFY